MTLEERLIQLVVCGILAFVVITPIALIYARIARYFKQRKARQALALLTEAPSTAKPLRTYLPAIEKRLKKQLIGLEELSFDELQLKLQEGGRFVCYSVVVSAVVLTSRQATEIYFQRADRYSPAARWVSTLFTFLFGWWGFPWGIIYTPGALLRNLQGGIDVSDEVVATIEQYFVDSRVMPAEVKQAA